jgi:hypothetical protein
MSASFAEAFIPAEQEHKNRVMHATWGHLAPEPRKKYRGYMVFACGQYRDIVVISSDYSDMPNSPWLYQAEHDFAFKKAKRGKVHRFDGTLMMCKNGKFKFSGKVRTLRV